MLSNGQIGSKISIPHRLFINWPLLNNEFLL